MLSFAPLLQVKTFGRDMAHLKRIISSSVRLPMFPWLFPKHIPSEIRALNATEVPLLCELKFKRILWKVRTCPTTLIVWVVSTSSFCVGHTPPFIFCLSDMPGKHVRFLCLKIHYCRINSHYCGVHPLCLRSNPWSLRSKCSSNPFWWINSPLPSGNLTLLWNITIVQR